MQNSLLTWYYIVLHLINVSTNISFYIMIYLIFFSFSLAFVKSDVPKQFPGLTVKYARGANSVIKPCHLIVVSIYVSFYIMIFFVFFFSFSLAFVKSDVPKQFPGLTVKYARGANPVIKLLDEDRRTVETLSIDKWNTDTVEDFLRERLR